MCGMKNKFTLSVPENVVAVMTISATISEWREIRKTMRQGLDSGAFHCDVQQFFHQIDAVIAQSEATWNKESALD